MRTMKNFSSFTLIEASILVVIIFILAVIATAGGEALSGLGKGKETSEKIMKEYIDLLHPELQNVRLACSNMDSDGNGYVRCTATGLKPNSVDREVIEAECPSAFSLKDQCVPLVPKIIGGR